MKADRLMRTNGRNNLWLLRNTNQIYESAVKCYYEHNNSILPHNSASKTSKQRKENFAPLRTVTSQCKLPNKSNYPLNHHQMVERATSANADKLLNTVMLANKRRSTSFAGNGLASYVYGNSKSSNDNNVQKGPRQSRVIQQVNMDELDQKIFGGRSMSLPPTSSTQLRIGRGYQSLQDALGQSNGCQKQHLMAMEKSSAAAIKEMMRHQAKRRLQQFPEEEELMKVDKVLKQSLAAHYKKEAASPRCVPPQQIKASSVPKEQIRFQSLGERIKQFEAIQLAEGPVAFNAFNAYKRRQSHGSGRAPQGSRDRSSSGKSQLPPQVPCLSCNNVLHANHRQRTSNSQLSLTERPDTPQMLLPVSLGPLQPVSQRPEQHQQGQHPPSAMSNDNDSSDMSPLVRKLREIRSKRSLKLVNSSKERMQQQKLPHLQQRWGATRASIHNPFSRYYPPKKHSNNNNNNNDTGSIATDSNTNNIPMDSTTITNNFNLRGSNKLSYNDDSTTPSNHQRLPQLLIESLWKTHEDRPFRKSKEQELPEQPATAKRSNHMLTASVAQISAHRQAYLRGQQIKLAELMNSRTETEEQEPITPQNLRTRKEVQHQQQMKELQQQQLEQQQQLRQQRHQHQQQQLLEQQQRLLHQPQQLPEPLQAISGKRGKLKQSLQVSTRSDKTQQPQQEQQEEQHQQQQHQHQHHHQPQQQQQQSLQQQQQQQQSLQQHHHHHHHHHQQQQQQQSSHEVNKTSSDASLSTNENWQWSHKPKAPFELQEVPSEQFFSRVLRKMQQRHLNQQLYQHRQQHQNNDRHWRIS